MNSPDPVFFRHDNSAVTAELVAGGPEYGFPMPTPAIKICRATEPANHGSVVISKDQAILLASKILSTFSVPAENISKVEAGQTWRDIDPRHQGRTLRVVKVDGDKAECLSAGPGKPARHVKVLLRRFLARCGDYRLLGRADEGH